MKLRTPSGKVVTNSVIASKLQLVHEKSCYSTEIESIATANDFIWLSNYFSQTNYGNIKRLDDVTSFLSKLRALQCYECFVELAAFELVKSFGIKLPKAFFTGAWMRDVDYTLVGVTILYLGALSNSRKSFVLNRNHRNGRNNFRPNWRLKFEHKGIVFNKKEDSLVGVLINEIGLLRSNLHAFDHDNNVAIITPGGSELKLFIDGCKLYLTLGRDDANYSLGMNERTSVVQGNITLTDINILCLGLNGRLVEVPLNRLKTMVDGLSITETLLTVRHYLQRNLYDFKRVVTHDESLVITHITLIVLFFKLL